MTELNSLLQNTSVSLEDKEEILLLLEELERKNKFNKLRKYTPYSKQIKHHNAGALHHERLFMAGNQLGKSLCGSAEWAMHLTGRYPDWWKGAVFEEAVTMWASSVTGISTRDNPQRLLIGPPAIKSDWGTGMIPGECIEETNTAMGIKNALDSAVVRWGGGGDVQAGFSAVYFKSYEQGQEKWQGPTIDGVWFDEEPPMDIYQEGKTRTNNGQNGIFTQVTFTPLKGMSEVVLSFLKDDENKKEVA